MHDTQFRLLSSVITQLGSDISHINSSLAQLVVIQNKRLIGEEKYMITADELGKLADAVTALITAKATDDTAIAAYKSQIATMTANDAALADPVLQAKMDALQAAAVSATVDPNAPPVVVPPSGNPEGVLFDASLTYIAGDTVLDTAGNLWTAVTPVVGEAPGVTAGNWTETTPAPTPVTPVGAP